MLNPEYSFEKTDLFSTPIWTSEFTEIDNNKIKDFLYRMQEDDQNNSSDEERRKWEYVWESGYCQLDSYKDIFLAFYPAIFHLTTNPRIIKIDDFTPKFYIHKKGSSSKLMNWVDRANDLVLMYFVQVPKDLPPTLLLKDPRPLIHGNYFAKKAIQKSEDNVGFEPSDGTCVVIPAYMEYYIDTNYSDEDLILFTTPLQLSW